MLWTGALPLEVPSQEHHSRGLLPRPGCCSPMQPALHWGGHQGQSPSPPWLGCPRVPRVLSSCRHALKCDHCPRPLQCCSSHLTPSLFTLYVPLTHPSARCPLQTPTPHPESFPGSSVLSLQIRLSGGRSRYEGRVEVQIGGPGPLRWGLICGDDWGTLEAMVVCRQLGLGYANHGLQVSRMERNQDCCLQSLCLGQRTWK